MNDHSTITASRFGRARLEMNTFKSLVLVIAIFGAAQAVAAGPPHDRYGPHPYSYPHFYHFEHPQHRLADWYVGESMRQNEEARSMVCGFTGQRWALDRELHYRWALSANPNRVYREIDERDRHLARCRSTKLRDFRQLPDPPHN